MDSKRSPIGFTNHRKVGFKGNCGGGCVGRGEGKVTAEESGWGGGGWGGWGGEGFWWGGGGAKRARTSYSPRRNGETKRDKGGQGKRAVRRRPRTSTSSHLLGGTAPVSKVDEACDLNSTS